MTDFVQDTIEGFAQRLRIQRVRIKDQESSALCKLTGAHHPVCKAESQCRRKKGEALSVGDEPGEEQDADTQEKLSGVLHSGLLM